MVAECDDSRLNDSQGRHVSPEEVVQALETAASGPVKKDLWVRAQEWYRINLKEGLARLHGFFHLKKEGIELGYW